MRRLLAAALVPLSLLPFAAVVPIVRDSRERYVRAHQMGPLPAPPSGLTAAERARFRPLPPARGRVPVLVWPRVTDARAFGRTLALLRHLGYHSLSSADWARFRAGAAVPPRSVLLTVDGGELASYRRADALLERFRMRATMVVATGPVEAGDPAYLRWAELRRMRASGRWDVEPAAHDGRRTITVDRSGRQAPFYTARRYTRSAGLETRAGWERRVAGDLFAVRDRFARQGIAPHVLALPYGDVGRRTANDPALPGLLSALLTRQFGNWFTQAADPPFTTHGTGEAKRFQVDPGTGLGDVYRWLKRKD
ncbi:MAG TPA: polysaccharide deacetylase family protein [Solirubrobacter sp.]|nr:polysaccharide deacetylase family protein [Solirubrobacter sp.]